MSLTVIRSALPPLRVDVVWQRSGSEDHFVYIPSLDAWIGMADSIYMSSVDAGAGNGLTADERGRDVVSNTSNSINNAYLDDRSQILVLRWAVSAQGADVDNTSVLRLRFNSVIQATMELTSASPYLMDDGTQSAQNWSWRQTVLTRAADAGFEQAGLNVRHEISAGTSTFRIFSTTWHCYIFDAEPGTDTASPLAAEGAAPPVGAQDGDLWWNAQEAVLYAFNAAPGEWRSASSYNFGADEPDGFNIAPADDQLKIMNCDGVLSASNGRHYRMDGPAHYEGFTLHYADTAGTFDGSMTAVVGINDRTSGAVAFKLTEAASVLVRKGINGNDLLDYAFRLDVNETIGAKVYALPGFRFIFGATGEPGTNGTTSIRLSGLVRCRRRYVPGFLP